MVTLFEAVNEAAHQFYLKPLNSLLTAMCIIQ